MLSIRFIIPALCACTSAVLVRPPLTTYGVDSFTQELIDCSRKDPYAAKQGIQEPRQLMVSVFYPTGPLGDCKAYNQSYMPNATAALYDSMYDQYGLPKGAFGALELSFCSNNLSLGQQASPPTFPTVLFSPGLGNSRLLYSGIAQSLASRGFIVATIDHPYDAAIVEYPDGSTVLAANISTTKQITFAVSVRVADVAFVMQQLESGVLNTTSTAQDSPQKFVMYGHSLGGATAVAAMASHPQILGAVNLDGTMFGPVVSSGVSCPMMLFAHPNHTLATDASWNSTWKHSAKATRLELVLKQSQHGTFTDFPLLVDAIGLPAAIRQQLAALIGSLPGSKVNSILGGYLDSFFGFALGEGQAVLPSVQSPLVKVAKKIMHGDCA